MGVHRIGMKPMVQSFYAYVIPNVFSSSPEPYIIEHTNQCNANEGTLRSNAATAGRTLRATMDVVDVRSFFDYIRAKNAKLLYVLLQSVSRGSYQILTSIRELGIFSFRTSYTSPQRFRHSISSYL